MFHLIAVTTVLPTLKSARQYYEYPRPPRIIKSGTVEVCYERAISINSGGLNTPIDLAENGCPIHQNGVWTYYLVEDKVEAI